MPVRSLTSSVLTWPDDATVHRAVQAWARDLIGACPLLRRVGYFGSYARGDWGVGSDLDVVLVVDRADGPFEERAAAVDATDLPVPADVLVYTAAEWAALTGRMREVLHHEVVWVAEWDGGAPERS